MKKQRNICISIIVAALVVAAFSFISSAKAQTKEEMGIPTTVQVSPIRFTWDLEDGEEKTGIVNLKNFSEDFYEVTVSTEDFYVSDDSTSAKFFVPDETHPLKAYDVIDWIETPQTIELAPDEARDITFKVKVPDGKPTGGYYGALFFLMKKRGDDLSQGESESMIVLNQRVGTLLIMAVKGDQPIIRKGELLDFKPRKKIFWESPAELIAIAENSGNLHFKVFSKVEIKKFGRKLMDVELTPQLLYPERTREIGMLWNFSGWSYGFYQAKISVISEDGGIKMEGQTSFWVIPWKTTLSIIILLVILWLIFRIFTSKFEIRFKGSDKKGEEKIPKQEFEEDENGDKDRNEDAREGDRNDDSNKVDDKNTPGFN